MYILICFKLSNFPVLSAFTWVVEREERNTVGDAYSNFTLTLIGTLLHHDLFISDIEESVFLCREKE
jgi:hypothetical protein